MKDVFSSHFADDVDRREKLWKNCFFVFDTNVLTSVYKRSDDARDALYKVIKSLGDRLWIPYQVVHELLDNRATIVHAQAGLYSGAIDSLTAVLESFNSTTKHPFLPESLHNEFVAVSNKVLDELASKRDFHDLRLTNDDVKADLAGMLAGKIGRRYSDEELKAITIEGEKRYANRIPPGFEDINKHKGSTVFSDVCKRYGDLIIWKQVIEKAKELNRPVIFVTGEQKDDWWNRQGGKTIGPLPRLIEEFDDETDQDFFLYSHHQFLDLANVYLKQNTSTEVIEEVRDAALNEEYKLYYDDSVLEHPWPMFSSDDVDGDNQNADEATPQRRIVISQKDALKLARQLLNFQDAPPGISPSGRLPNDPREVRRRRLAAERDAIEQNRLRILNARKPEQGPA